MARYVFDTEFNGFLENATVLHSLVLYDLDNHELHSFADQPNHRPISEGLRMMDEADELIGHFIINYDLPALAKVKKWHPRDGTKITDTVVLCRVLFTDIGESDNKLIAKGVLDRSLWGSHKLEAWGQRLGNKKIKYEGGFEAWNPDMQKYCEQDVLANVTLYRHVLKRMADLRLDISRPWWEIEHGVAAYCHQLERNGFPFDRGRAIKLYGELVDRRAQLEAQMQEVFPPIFVPDKLFVPKKDNMRMGYVAGAPLTKVVLQEFNPGSRPQIIERLRRFRNWKPTEFTENGNPKIDDDVLRALPWPEAKFLGEYLMVQKRIGQLAEGDAAWLKMERNGIIHGGINPGGTNTGRASHSEPNLAQVPAITNKKGEVPYGRQCRELFTCLPGYTLLGADLSGIELRCLAHYLSPFDDGAYASVVVEGDVHTRTVEALAPVITIIRSIAKTFIYAYLYGAGDAKLGKTLDPTLGDKKARELGRAAREAIEQNVPGLGELQRKLKKAWKARGFIYGLDGRPLFPRSEHSILNTLLQNAGAVVAKKWLLEQERVLVGYDHVPHAWVHDEVQMSVRPDEANAVGTLICGAATMAGIELGFQCRVDASYHLGRNWAETH